MDQRMAAELNIRSSTKRDLNPPALQTCTSAQSLDPQKLNVKAVVRQNALCERSTLGAPHRRASTYAFSCHHGKTAPEPERASCRMDPCLPVRQRCVHCVVARQAKQAGTDGLKCMTQMTWGDASKKTQKTLTSKHKARPIRRQWSR